MKITVLLNSRQIMADITALTILEIFLRMNWQNMIKMLSL